MCEKVRVCVHVRVYVKVCVRVIECILDSFEGIFISDLITFISDREC